MINTSIMLALCLNAFVSYYAQAYASIICQGLVLSVYTIEVCIFTCFVHPIRKEKLLFSAENFFV